MQKGVLAFVLAFVFVIVGSFVFAGSTFAKPKNKKSPQAKSKKTKKAPRKKSDKRKKIPPTRRTTSKKPAPRPRAPQTKAEKIVEKMVVVTGGRKGWGEVKTVLAKGITRLVTVLGEKKATIVAYELRPNYQRLDMSFGRQIITQSYHPKGGWMRQNGVVFRLPRSMLDMTKSETVRANLELRYALEPIKVKFLRTRTIRGQKCDVIVFRDAKNRRTTYYISQNKSLLLKRSYVGPSPLGTGKKRFSVYYSLFRWVNIPGSTLKLKMPFQVENYIGGRKVGTIQLQKVQINAKSITPKIFLQPNPVE